MKGFLRSKLVLTLVALIMIASAIAVPLAGNFIRAHAQTPPTVSFTKAVKEATVAPGGTVDYTLTLTNTSPPGTIELHDIHLTDILPSGLTAITKGPTFTITPPTGGGFGDCNGTSGLTVSCTVDNFAPGSKVTITFSASVSKTATGTITNTATAQSTVVSATDTASTKVTTPPPPIGKPVLLCGLDALEILGIGGAIKIAGHSYEIVGLITKGVHGVLALQDVTSGKRVDAIIEILPFKDCVDLLLLAFPKETQEDFDELLRGTIQAAIDSLCETLLLPPTGKIDLIRDLCGKPTTEK